MAQKKVKFTLVDALIIVVVIAAAAVVALKFMPSKMTGGEKSTAVFTVMLTGKDENFASAIHIGDVVSISNKEKDTGVVTAVEAKVAESLEYNSNEGKYAIQTIESKRDVYVTIEADSTEDEKLIEIGTTPIKVGLAIPVRGKGYASTGYIVEVDTVNGGAE
jgi:hypothetical protein